MYSHKLILLGKFSSSHTHPVLIKLLKHVFSKCSSVVVVKLPAGTKQRQFASAVPCVAVPAFITLYVLNFIVLFAVRCCHDWVPVA